MKQVILIHGLPDREEFYGKQWPSPSNSHWLPWVQREVLQQGMMCQALEMPHPYNPSYKDHCKVLDQISISEETILVGHSCGGGFLVRYFSENKQLSPKKIILVAPWLDLEGYLKEIDPDTEFFNFSIDPELSQRTKVEIMYSTDDESYILDTVKRIQEEIEGIHEHVFSNKGHFTEPDLKSKEFPELVELILK
jgi:predicted alpha/beta hydrolase family esterase